MQEPQSPQVREDVRQFHVETCLGSGGFGEVYKAVMTSAGGVRHDVAIKVLHEGLDPRSQAVQRLRDEGRMLGVLRHPAILRVHDLVILAGRVSLVTEYIEGADLDDCIGSGTLSHRALVDVIGQVAAALDAAWNTESPDGEGKLHLVHRDVKPANIRVGRHGEVKLLDFGIAKAAGVQREAHTQARALIGSYLYMSPERLDRKEGFVPEGDVYALGAVLYEGVAGKRLFGQVDLKEQYKLSWDAGEHDLFIKRRVDAIPDLPEPIRDLLMRTLAHDETERPSAHALSQECEELADTLPGTSLRQWCRAFDWPEPGRDLGALGGRTITETAFTTGTISSSTLQGLTRPEGEDGDEESSSRAPGTMAMTGIGFLDGSSTLASVPEEEVSPVEEPARRRSPLVLAFVGLVGLGLVGLVGLVGGAFVMFGGGGASAEGAPEVEPAPAPALAVDPEPTPAPDVDPEPDALPEGATDDEAPEAAPVPAPPDPAAAPAPAPAPAPAATPGPEPGAPGTAEPAPKPPPTPKAPAAAVGTLSITGSVPVEFRSGAGSFGAGDVPAGGYEVWAEFDSEEGMVRAIMEMVQVPAGGAVSIKCSGLAHKCWVL